MGQQVDYKIRTELLHWIKKIGSQFDTSYIVRDPSIPEKPIVYVNEAFTKITGFAANEVIGESITILHGERRFDSMEKRIDEDLEMAGSTRLEVLNFHKDGTPIWFNVIAQTFRNPQGDPIYEVAFQTDITVQKQQEAIIEMQAVIYEGIENGYDISVLLQEICNKVEQFFIEGTMCTIMAVRDNKLHNMAGKSLPFAYRESIEGLDIGPFVGSCGAAAYLQQIVITENLETSPNWLPYLGEGPNEFGLKSCWSFPIINHAKETIATFGIYFTQVNQPAQNDLTFIQKIVPLVLLALRNAEDQKKILHLAYRDQETELPNMNYFYNDVKELDENGENRFIAVISSFNYPEIVDMFGREIASLVLREIGNRLNDILVDYDYVLSRFTSSALIIAGNTKRDDYREIVKLLLRVGHFPIRIDRMEIYLPIQMGVIPYIKGADVHQLIRQADLALSEARKRNGEQVYYYAPEMEESIKHNMELQSAIETGLRNQEFTVHLQPKVDMESGRIISFEALARLNSSKLGWVSPIDFIDATEKAGKIEQLEHLIIRQVLAWISKRIHMNQRVYQVAINISPNHFYSAYFVKGLLGLIEEYGVSPSSIVIELTESIGLGDLDKAKTIIRELKKAGIECSIDDFGIGYSSLSYLQELPISEIKIDRSFINQIQQSGTRVILQAIIDIADKLDIRAVAEGIETYEQMILLRGMSCSIGQGYYFHKPMSLEQIDEIIKTEET
ncbi:EAL domain-containing protein [Chryseomicrobium palamuruense]|uniref:EAL domain-containing protein n=1 Tax=Chryseomicrobium palamuruense TaxID=682973 RepID=A0ABV8UU93_9BACL